MSCEFWWLNDVKKADILGCQQLHHNTAQNTTAESPL